MPYGETIKQMSDNTADRRSDAGNEDNPLITEQRRDRGFLRAPVRTAQGFLLAEGVAALAGVHDYLVRDPDGKARIVRELIEDDVLRADAGQIGRLPLTLHHPLEDVSPENIDELGVGEVGERVKFIEDAQGGYVQVSVCTRRADAIAAVLDGTAGELSFGYEVMVDPTPGVHPIHGSYDQRQVRRIYNHLALVDQARHGPDARLRVDRGDDLSEDFIGLQLPHDRLKSIQTIDAQPTTTPIKTPAPSGQGGSMEFLRALAAQLKIPRWDSLTEEGLKSAIQDRGDELLRVCDSVESLRKEDRSDMQAYELVSDMVGAHAQQMEDMAHKMAEVVRERDEMKAANAEKMAELMATMEALRASEDMLKGQLEESNARGDAAQSKLDAVELEARQRADAAALTKLSAVADALKVDSKTDDGSNKDLATLRRDCAAAIFGAELPASYSDDAITGILAPALRKLDAGEKLIDESRSDSRYDSFRRHQPANTSTKTPRPSLRSRAESMHNGRTS